MESPMKSYSAVKRNEAGMHATTWMNLKNIMLIERNQLQKATVTRFYDVVCLEERVYGQSRLVVARG